MFIFIRPIKYVGNGNLAARHVANTTCVGEWYNPIYGTNVAAMIHRHSSPGEGLAPLQIQPVWLNGTTPYNDKRFCVGRYKYKCTTVPALRAGWRQIAAATLGVPCFGWYHSPPQVIHPTWRAANSRPYVNVPRFLHFLEHKTPQGPLSLGCAEPALPEGEPRVP